MEDNNIEERERRYQILVGDFQAGKIDEAAFVVEVEKLQFQDDYGRYWMLGSQTGSWHYYDGQNWRQADPRDRDKLPFMDDQGRYWQRGAKSGDWYYYQPETGEWVKPGQDDPSRPSSMGRGGQGQTAATGAASQPAAYQQQPQAAAYAAGQFDSQLYQDDEGRYWTIGAKTGQWYFYDANGWHPAHEFQTQSYATQSTAYAAPSAYQPYPAQQPAQSYVPPTSAPPQPIPANPAMQSPGGEAAMPAPPQGATQGGVWYYHDGKQWLKYATGEPANETPPDPALILEHDSGPSIAKPKTQASEPMVAELYEEDEPAVEVVDIEVITVYEAEPDIEPEATPKPVAPQPKAEPTRAATPNIDEYIPRRTRTPSTGSSVASRVKPQPKPEAEFEDEPDPQPKRRAPADPAQPVRPRKREAHHEPTIIIPTGAAASPISSPSTTRAKMQTRPVQPEVRHARDDTLPMGPAPLPGSRPSPQPTPLEGGRHRQVTQQLPKISSSAIPHHADTTGQAPAVRTRQSTPEMPLPAQVAAAATMQPAQTIEAEEKGFTFGDVLRSLPSTLWTVVIGLAVMFLCAVVIIIGGMSWFDGGAPLGGSGIAAAQSPVPTLDPGIVPDSTPTLGPTPTESAPIATPTPASLTSFSSANLGITLKYPENWEFKEEANQVIFSPSAEGLNPNQFAATSMRIGAPPESNPSISEMLSGILKQFPSNLQSLNEGTISIASQTWTSTQIRFEDEGLGGQGIATVAVTNKEGTGYFLVAIAPAEAWNSVQPIFQEMINSFRFEQVETPLAQDTTDSATNALTESATSTPTPEPSPTIQAALDPVIHIVESGDTPLGIANQYGVDVDLLLSENGIADPTALRVGQELTIPFTAEQLAAYYAGGGATAAGSQESAAAPSPQEQAAAPAESAQAAEPVPQPEPTEAASPAAALSGKMVYPAYNPNNHTYDIWLADLASGEQNGFVGNASQPVFNKDGTLLAYRSWDLGTRGIFFKDFVGGRGGIVTRFVEDGMPSWSPDGFTFAFASRKEGDRVSRIYVGNQLGENPIGLAFQGVYPATMPDGRLVVKGCTPPGDCGIFVMGPRGGGEKKIADHFSDTAPAPSPDGSKIAFMSSREGNNYEIWVMNADGSNPKRLTENNNNDGLPTWSPDGQSIAFASDRGGAWAIWVMNADGSNQRKLLDMKGSPDGVVLHDEPNSKGWLEERISWAP
jgi:TolB protein